MRQTNSAKKFRNPFETICCSGLESGINDRGAARVNGKTSRTYGKRSLRDSYPRRCNLNCRQRANVISSACTLAFLVGSRIIARSVHCHRFRVIEEPDFVAATVAFYALRFFCLRYRWLYYACARAGRNSCVLLLLLPGPFT